MLALVVSFDLFIFIFLRGVGWVYKAAIPFKFHGFERQYDKRINTNLAGMAKIV